MPVMQRSEVPVADLTSPEPDRRILLTGGFVITMDPGIGDVTGDVLIVGDRIRAVGRGLAAGTSPDTLVIDLTGAIVIPGLIDSHVHAWSGALRGIAPDADFWQYMSITHGGIAAFMRPEDIAIGQRITAAQAINGGVTTIIDNSHNSRSPEHSDAAISALRAAGIRAVHAVGAPTMGSEAAHLPQDLLRLRDTYFSSDDQLLSLRLFEATATPEGWQFAADNGFGIVTEMGGHNTDLDRLLASGLAGPDHTYNHCGGLTAEQWARVADSGAAVNLVPRSDSYYCLGGFIPALQVNRHGIQEGISSDNELNYGHDLFTEMRVLLTIQRGLSSQASFAGEQDVPRPYGVRDVLRAATVGGAINAGLGSRTGTLTPGKKADLVVLDLDSVPTSPSGSLVGTVVNFAAAANVDAVFVDGIARKWAGRLTDTDYCALVSAAENSRERLLLQYGTSLAEVRAGTNILIHQADGAVGDSVRP